MTETQARNAANVVMAAAALGAVVVVLRNPKLRRIAWQLVRQYANGPLAAWTAGTVRGAWDASGQSIAAGAVVAEQGAPAARIAPVA